MQPLRNPPFCRSTKFFSSGFSAIQEQLRPYLADFYKYKVFSPNSRRYLQFLLTLRWLSWSRVCSLHADFTLTCFYAEEEGQVPTHHWLVTLQCIMYIIDEPGEQCTFVFALIVPEPASEYVCVCGGGGGRRLHLHPSLPITGSETSYAKTTVHCSPGSSTVYNQK